MNTKITHSILWSLSSLLSWHVYANDLITPDSVFWRNEKASIELVRKSDQRQFQMKTNTILRDGIPAYQTRTVTESTLYPRMTSNSVLFDGLFALAINEMIENSVEQITDHSFSTSDCHCFETGRKWNYVWTRDIAYSAHLALASLNQERTLQSLLFKVSKQRAGSDNSLEVVQDTGTGGSWPISTDRVVWALAANELLEYLSGNERINFLKTTYTALKNTIDHDRVAVFDRKDGLYTGEQSFLDWREQSYPNWVTQNVVHVGMSKALSTNVTHYIALQTLANVSLELGYAQDFKKYSNWAHQLKQNINKNFWDEKKGLYSTFLTTFLDQKRVHKYDLLGISLAIISDIAESESQKISLQNYPLVQAGAPVMWPQDPDAPIYHNRGIWPFVTNYALLAAKKNKQARLFNHYAESMIRGSALNLSNMENFEFITLNNWQDDGVYSGPVVNSQRQLWSVAGYLSMIVDGFVGKTIQNDHLAFKPFITDKIRNTILKQSQSLKLSNFKFKNKEIDIIIHLPTSKAKWHEYAYYDIKSIKLNNQTVSLDKAIHYSTLSLSNTIEIELGDLQYSQERISLYQINSPHQIDQRLYEKLFHPKTPKLYPIKDNKGHPHLNFEANSFESVVFNIYRDGKLIEENFKGSNYVDLTAEKIMTPCYVIETVFASSANRSLPSEPHCFWRANSIQTHAVTDNNVSTLGNNDYYSSHGKIYLKRWGATTDILKFQSVQVPTSGTYAFQLVYNNLGHINTGITATVKKVEIINQQTSQIIETGVFMMPHHTREIYWIDSNFVRANLKANSQYTIRISDFYNMSYFEHFNNYLFRGGRSGAYNFADIAELTILRLE